MKFFNLSDLKLGVFILFVLAVCSSGRAEVVYKCSDMSYANAAVADKPQVLFVLEGYHKGKDWDGRWNEICFSDADENFKEIYHNRTDLLRDDHEYDSQTSDLFTAASILFHQNDQYSSEYKIEKFNLKNKEMSTVIDFPDEKATNFTVFETIAYDWVTKNMFFIGNHHHLKVVNVNDATKTTKTLYSFKDTEEKPWRKIRVFPNHGYLVVATAKEIIRFNLDGTNPKSLYKTNNRIHHIIPDQFKQDIYWMEGDVKGDEKPSIRCMSLNGSNVKQFEVFGDDNISRSETLAFTMLEAGNDYIYYGIVNSDGLSLRRAKKTDGTHDPDFKIDAMDRSFNFIEHSYIVLNAHHQKVHKDHPCKINNGGCPDFCVAVPDPAKNEKLIKKCIE